MRRVFMSRATGEGVAALATGRLLDEGYPSGGSGIELAHHRRAMLDYARLLAVIAFHARGASIADITSLFRQRALLSRAAARDEATRVAIDPAQGDGGLGRLFVTSIAAEHARRNPLTPRAVLEEQLIAAGLVPPRIVALELLGTGGTAN